MTNKKSNKAINIALWIAQGLLALMFIMAGLMKATQPIEALTEALPWVANTPLALVKFIGISELLGGLGLLIPSIFRWKTNLTILAALGLALVMILASGFHASRGEFSAIGMNVILLILALFIAWGRRKKAPILSKN
ncbi:DoxX family protein [Olleya aquimaris]|uniref:DoxX family protein n=1 Tax=Olleya sediminilitoris TaxID=2795739 RepID=A0ABS1WIS3_9FLAO|nr:DoxX family protein [Olleya sediminilitoris]AXO79259.1 DoxX family protein [Olleya aquimaris]MBL7558992.1 DoxX family protein [Olleya sediminilitoris]